MLGGPEFQLKLDEGRVYGARYYTVQPMGYAWYEGEARWAEMMEWTTEHFGKCGSVWKDNLAPAVNHRWYANDSKFWFRNEEDLTMFVLRWS
jgi:hypothetical protein